MSNGTTNKGHFQELYMADADQKKMDRMKLVERKVRRSIESAYDSLQDKRIVSNEKIDYQFGHIENGIEINQYLERVRTLHQLDETEKDLDELYKYLFGTRIPKR